MSRTSNNTNGLLISLVFVLVLTSVSPPKWTVSAATSSVQGRSFKRPDPLRRLKYYRGGYNVTNKHYWASTAYTGIYGYVIAGIWLLFGLGFGVFLLVKSPNNGPAFLDHHFYPIFLLVLLFTILAVAASGLVVASTVRSERRTERLKETIVQIGKDAQRIIRTVVKEMKQMETLLLPYDPLQSMSLKVITHRLSNESRTIQNFVHKTGHSIDLAARISYIGHLLVVSINLVLFVAALVHLLLVHWHPGFITIIFCCWLLTTLCWGITAFDFFFHTFAEDTCSAVEEFTQNPYNSSLSTMIPCMDPSSSNAMLVGIGYTTHTYISRFNSKAIEFYTNILGLNVEESQGLFGDVKICDPFSGAPDYTYAPASCPDGSISIGNIPNILASVTCNGEDSTAKCRTEGKFLPEEYYEMAWAYSHVAQNLLNIYPDLRTLSQCTFVKDKFSDIVLNQCKPFRKSLRWLWAAMLSLSIFMVALVLIWVIKANQDKGKSFSRCSIHPNPT